MDTDTRIRGDSLDGSIEQPQPVMTGRIYGYASKGPGRAAPNPTTRLILLMTALVVLVSYSLSVIWVFGFDGAAGVSGADRGEQAWVLALAATVISSITSVFSILVYRWSSVGRIQSTDGATHEGHVSAIQ